MLKNIIYYSCVLIFLSVIGMRESLSQPMPKGEAGPNIRLGEIHFQVRELESTPSPLKILEIHIEIFNKSRQTIAPPNSIKLALVPKEVKYPEGASATEFSLTPEETTLDVPLPPNTGRILIIGLQLPEKKIESIFFEIQINPPDGEKKTVVWEGI